MNKINKRKRKRTRKRRERERKRKRSCEKWLLAQQKAPTLANQKNQRTTSPTNTDYFSTYTSSLAGVEVLLVGSTVAKAVFPLSTMYQPLVGVPARMLA
jgi:hypothetical protein